MDYSTTLKKTKNQANHHQSKTDSFLSYYKKADYQTVQVFFGAGHPNALLNSGKLCSGTRTLKFILVKTVKRYNTSDKYMYSRWKLSSVGMMQIQSEKTIIYMI